MVHLYVDIETKGLNAQEYLLGCLTNEKEQTTTYKTPQELWNAIKTEIAKKQKRKQRTYIYGHYHQYDFIGYTKGELTDSKWQFLVTNPFIIRYDTHGWFLDSYSFYHMTLDKAGEMIGIPKLDKPSWMGREPQTPQEWKELETYCTQDTIVTKRLMDNLREVLKELGYKPRKLLTPAQTAMTAWQTYLKKNYAQTNDLYEDYTGTTPEGTVVRKRRIRRGPHDYRIRDAYRGGRVQSFKTGTFHNVTGIDKRKLYTYIMSTMRFPDLRTQTFIEEPETKGYTQESIFQKLGVARVTITTPKKQLGLLPTRYQRENVYPEGSTITATYTTSELLVALKNKHYIHKIHWCIIYNDAKNPWTDYLLELQKSAENTTNKAKQHVIKLLQNSLSGKFAQQTTEKDIKIIKRSDSEPYLQAGYQITGHSDIYYYLEKTIRTYEPSYTNPLLSALITANGRIYLWNHLKNIPRKDLLYTDTDSAYYTGNHNHHFLIDNTIEGWKITNTNSTFHGKGKKSYCVDNELHVSGIRKNEVSPEDYIREKTISVPRMNGIMEALQKGNLDIAGTFEQKNISFTTVQEEKYLREYVEPEEPQHLNKGSTENV